MNMINKIRERVRAIDVARARKKISIAVCVILALWVIWRFVSYAMEQRMVVFNAARDAASNGTPVTVIDVRRAPGILNEPIFVRNNRAYVSSTRVHNFTSGMRIDDGEIASVYYTIDIDTGMHIINTRHVSDGLHMAQYQTTGYFIPLYAINDNSVMVVENGVARRRDVTIVRADADNALIGDGLTDGDIVILTHVTDGQKIQIQK